ncbi:pentatricopeptide repeat-containing protein At4g02750-like [Selaginella moellendorffii]|uniref:pentatricopeptide repeat-containing protein At4g02750-like n=1 Tax=Selaginella moellendorffii TaxID=88036 RepID=UPI000D1C685A|nr:pentatricopeptide repeat-containing protein At4g02750-like [Selaginella moellendorffii]|eukprot:XP_024526964.1 pentatricopeptide repeat-containing protein At4g02750-like [Selaginella moellendorffii]
MPGLGICQQLGGLSLEIIRSCKTLPQAKRIHAQVSFSKDLVMGNGTHVHNMIIQMYDRCGSFDLAHSVFLALSNKDIFSYAHMINAFVRSGNLNYARQLFDQMPLWNLIVLNAMLAAYSLKGYLVEAVALFDKFPERDIFTFTTMITIYAKNGKVEEARNIFDEHSMVSSTTMLVAYSQAELLPEAQALFDSMPLRNLVAWNAMLSGYSQRGHLRESIRLFHKQPVHDIVTLNSMLFLYAHKGLLTEAQNLFYDMPERNIVTWNAMLVAYTYNGHLPSAEEMFSRMPRHDSVSCNILLSAYAQKGDLEKSKSIFYSMEEKNVISWNAMLTAYAQNGHVEDANKLFEGMEDRNTVSWNGMMAAYVKQDKIENAKILFEMMPVHDVVSWTALITAYAQRGHMDEAKCLFENMPEKNLITWNSILAAYSQHGFLEEAKLVFDSMEEHDMLSWTSMLTAFGQRGLLKKARKTLDTMPEQDGISWNAMLAIYAQAGYLHKSLTLAKSMDLEGTRLTESSFISILIACSHSGSVLVGVKCFVYMINDQDVKPNRQIYSCMTDLLGRAGHLVEAEELVKNMPYTPDITDWSAKFRLNLPPGPWGFPLIGHLHLFTGGKPQHKVFQALSDKYGPIVSLRFGMVPTALISSSSLMRELFTTQDNNFSSKPYLVAGEYIGYNFMGLGTCPYGEDYKNSRKLCTMELLTTKAIDSFSWMRSKELASLLDALVLKSDSVNVRSIISTFIFNTITQNLISKRYFEYHNGPMDPETVEFKEVAMQVLDFIFKPSFSNFVPWYLRWMDWELPYYKQVHASQDRFIQKIVEEHKHSTRENKDFLDIMLQFYGPEKETQVKANLIVSK